MSDSDMIHPNLRHLVNSPLGSGASVPPQPMQPSPQHLLTVSWQPGVSPEPDESSSNYLKIGLGVGLGVPFLILICCYMARLYHASRKRRVSLPRYVSDVRPPTPPLRSNSGEPEQPRSPIGSRGSATAASDYKGATIRNRLTPNGSRRSLEEIMEEGMGDTPFVISFTVPSIIIADTMSEDTTTPPLIPAASQTQ